MNTSGNTYTGLNIIPTLYALTVFGEEEETELIRCQDLDGPVKQVLGEIGL